MTRTPQRWGPNRWARHGGLGPEGQPLLRSQLRWVRLNEGPGLTSLLAREINAGQELTLPTTRCGTSRSTTSRRVVCGADQCRGSVTGWKDPAGDAQGRLRRARRGRTSHAMDAELAAALRLLAPGREIRAHDDRPPPPLAGPATVLAALAVGLVAITAHAAPVSHAARARARTTTCDLSASPTARRRLRHVPEGLAREMRESRPGRESVPRLPARKGPSGRCVRLVSGYALGEIRSNGPTEFTTRDLQEGQSVDLPLHADIS